MNPFAAPTLIRPPRDRKRAREQQQSGPSSSFPPSASATLIKSPAIQRRLTRTLIIVIPVVPLGQPAKDRISNRFHPRALRFMKKIASC
jgi:hypothetical protein